MSKFTTFGFDPPLRASATPSLMQCPMRAALLHLDVVESTSGEAAQTGSVAHAMIEHWHKGGAGVDSNELAAEFPDADRNKATKIFDAYAHDPRNQACEVAAIEHRLDFTVPTPSGDLPVVFQGTLDQLRREDGRLRLYDVKTGRVGGYAMTNAYAYQFAVYCVGATAFFGEPVEPGAIIRTQGYFARGAEPPSPEGVFYEMPITLDDCYRLVDNIVAVVERVRRGEIDVVPGDYCSWCPAGGVSVCLNESERFNENVA